VKNEKKHSGKPRAKQGSQADIPEPNKIAASTSFDFDGKYLTPYGGLFPVATMLEKLGFQKAGRGNTEGEAHPAGYDHLSIRAGDGVGHLRWVLPPQSHPLCGQRSDADRGAEGGQPSRAERVLAVLRRPGFRRTRSGARGCLAFRYGVGTNERPHFAIGPLGILRRGLCRELCRNPAIPARIGLCRRMGSAIDDKQVASDHDHTEVQEVQGAEQLANNS
jgi:hypothetical protein